MMYARIIIIFFFPIFAIAQAPQKINFQSILRNTNGEVVANKSVSLKISILSGSISGSSVYGETHNKTTDASGLISLQIGNGTVLSGIFANIDWGGVSHFIKLEADFSGGSNYVVLGTQELMSVPYALYATKTDTSVLNLTSRLATKLSGTDTVSLSNRINAKAPLANPVFTGTVSGVTKTMVGLGNVDNSSDLNKPVSTATQTALDLKLNRSDFPSGTNTGNILYWNGTGWVNLAPGQNGQALILVNGIPSWSTLSTIVTVTDIDGNTYNTVQIGNQVWMSENLKTTRYRNGGQIPNVTTDNTAWVNLTTGAWSYYNNDVSNNAIYGKLYNWYTTLGDTLCPTGWGVPTDAEWTTLTTYLGGESVAGGKMKTIGNAYWEGSNTGAINSSGFSVLPGGGRFNGGSFGNISYYAFFWSATEYDGSVAWFRVLNASDGLAYRSTNGIKSFGVSVRCLRD